MIVDLRPGSIITIFGYKYVVIWVISYYKPEIILLMPEGHSAYVDMSYFHYERIAE